MNNENVTIPKSPEQIVEYCLKHDFISQNIVKELKETLEQEGTPDNLRFITARFWSGHCPNCGAEGSFK